MIDWSTTHLLTRYLVGTVADHREHLVLRQLALRCLLRQATLLNDDGVQLELEFGAFDDLLLDGVLGHHAVDEHRLLLADSVCAILRLQILQKFHT